MTASLAVAAAGCAPLTTLTEYDPSDGIRVSVGDQVIATNLMILTAEEGAPGLVLGSLTNTGDTAVDVTLAAEGLELVVPVGASTTVLLQPENGEELILDAVPVAPGAVLEMTISSPEAGSARGDVPVLDGTIAPYDEYLPDPDDVATPETAETTG